MSPYEKNHPQLAYIVPGSFTEPPKMAVKLGPDYLSVELTGNMLLNLAEQIQIEIRKKYGSAKSERNGD